MAYQGFAPPAYAAAPSTNAGNFAIPGIGLRPPFTSPSSVLPDVTAPATGASSQPTLVLPPGLQNITSEQLAALWAHVQSGALTLPPPPPPPPCTTVAQPLQPSQMPSWNRSNSSNEANVLAEETVFLERLAPQPESSHLEHTFNPGKEDGELSDGEMDESTSQDSPQSSRKRKMEHTSWDPQSRKVPRIANHERGQAESIAVPNQWDPTSSVIVSNAQRFPKTIMANGHSARPGRTRIDQLLHERESLFSFIAVLHDEGFTFNEVCREVDDEEMLRSIYTQLNLPVRGIPVIAQRNDTPPAVDTPSSPRPVGNSVIHQNGNLVRSVTPNDVVQVDRRPSLRKPSQQAADTPKTSRLPHMAISKAAPVKIDTKSSRSEYLARLQAAKKSKAETVEKDNALVPARLPVKVVETPVVKSSTGASSATIDVPKSKATSGAGRLQLQAPVDNKEANEKLKQTELIRKRMEALKAIQKQREQSAQRAAASTPVQTADNTFPLPEGKDVHRPQAGSSHLPGIDPHPHSIPAVDGAQDDATEQTELANDFVSHSHNSGQADGAPFTPTTRYQPRKRPVASDLIDSPGPSMSNYESRPFGQSRQNSSDEAMVIEVSDDESDEADLTENEEGRDTIESYNTTQDVPQPTLIQRRMRDFPPLHDFHPPRSPFIKSAIAIGASTPVVSTPGSAAEIEELRRKEEEITALNRRIAAYEKRKAAGVTKSMTGTPQSRSSIPAPIARTQKSLSTNQPNGSAGDPAQTVDDSDGTADAPTPTMLSNLGLPVQLQSRLAVESCDQLPTDVAKRLKMRADLSVRDAMINAKRAKMEEMQRQLQQMQEDFEEEMRAQDRLRLELAEFDVDTEGMTRAEMEEKKVEIVQQLQEGQSVIAESRISPSQSEQMRIAPEWRKETDLSTPGELQSRSSKSTDGDVSMKSISETYDESGSEDGEIADSSEQDQPEAVRDVKSSASVTDGRNSADRVDANMEDNYAPDPSQLAPEDIAPHATNPQSGHDDATASEEIARLYLGNLAYAATVDEVKGLFAGYDVVDVILPTNPRTMRPVGYAFITLPAWQSADAIAKVHNTELRGRRVNTQPARPVEGSRQVAKRPLLTVPVEDSDDPEDVNTSAELSSSDSNSGSEASDAEASVQSSPAIEPNRGVIEDLSHAAQSDLSSDNDMTDSEYEPADQVDGARDIHGLVNDKHDTDRSTHADALAPELQRVQTVGEGTAGQDVGFMELEKESANFAQTAAPADLARQTHITKYFTPYDSVLKVFKKYRFHPAYVQNVPGGYRSMTYSHQIDEKTPICQFESNGGQCNDTTCDGQHFRDMQIPDDVLLIQMGTKLANPGRDAEETERYKNGLVKVVQQLKVKDVRDTEFVADHIAKYRREFLGDGHLLGF